MAKACRIKAIASAPAKSVCGGNHSGRMQGSRRPAASHGQQRHAILDDKAGGEEQPVDQRIRGHDFADDLQGDGDHGAGGEDRKTVASERVDDPEQVADAFKRARRATEEGKAALLEFITSAETAVPNRAHYGLV